MNDLPQSYPDPRRRWGRAGALVAAWWSLWLAAGWIVPPLAAAMQGGPGESVLDRPPTTAQTAATRYLRDTIGTDPEVRRARDVMCSGPVDGMTPDDLIAWQHTDVDDPRIAGDYSVESTTPVGDGGTRFELTAYIQTSPTSRRGVLFAIDAVPDGDSWCVSRAVIVDDPFAVNLHDPVPFLSYYFGYLTDDYDHASAAAMECAGAGLESVRSAIIALVQDIEDRYERPFVYFDADPDSETWNGDTFMVRWQIIAEDTSEFTSAILQSESHAFDATLNRVSNAWCVADVRPVE